MLHAFLLFGLISICCGESWAENPTDDVPDNSTASPTLTFNADIRPILSDNCFACHGPDQHGRKAGLRLDVRQDAIDAAAIDVDDIEMATMIERITSDDPDLVMPPPETGKKVTPEQIAMIRQWMRAGATYEKHWSFVPVPDDVPLADAGKLSPWAKTDLDHFVAAKLNQRGLQPAQPAERSVWLRRVCFDLTGLPPTMEQLDAFLSDSSPDAYENVVDNLLNDSAYGERMANMWLDVARYADTFGYQADVEMDVWPWRDWVINAFNQNMTYDQFLTEQIAGDLIPNGSVQQRLATTFNRLHRQTNEGGSIPEEFRVANVVDRTSTFSTAFMGLTFECARCHDHKFDPISQEDFYRLSSFFSNIDELGVYSHFTHTAPTPSMPLYQDAEENRHQELLQRIARQRDTHGELRDQRKQFYSQHADQVLSGTPDLPKPAVHDALDGNEEGIVDVAKRFNGDDAHNLKDAPEFGRGDPMSLGIWLRPSIHHPRMLVLHQSVAAEDAAFRGLQLTLRDGHPQFS
ncbi:MAG: DUF1549 domain-containing protein, partial [Planctomycetota bacterium]